MSQYLHLQQKFRSVSGRRNNFDNILHNARRVCLYNENKNRTTLYIGVTNDLIRRVKEHKTHEGSAFTTKYKLTDLLYFETINGFQNAIDREKQLKNWHKEWKWNLIKETNPELKDLSEDWFE